MKTLSLLLSFILVTALQAQKTNLQLNLQIGQTYTQVQTSNLKVSQTINDQLTETTITMSGRTNYAVKAIQDSVYLMNMSFESLSMKMESAQGSTEVSSDDDKTDITTKIFKALTHKPILAKMSKRGRILEVGSDSLIESILNQFPDISEQQREQFKEQMKQSYGEKAFKTSFEMFSAVYPDKPVQQGDKWTIKSTLESTVLMNLDAVYTFSGKTANSDEIHGETKMTPMPGNKESNINGMPVVYDLSGTISSDISLDKKSGWIVKAELVQNITGTAQIKDNPQVPGGLTIPMTMSSEIILTDK